MHPASEGREWTILVEHAPVTGTTIVETFDAFHTAVMRVFYVGAWSGGSLKGNVGQFAECSEDPLTLAQHFLVHANHLAYRSIRLFSDAHHCRTQ